MRSILLLASSLLLVASAPAQRRSDVLRWQAQAARVTIIRDDWGIAHVYGKTDADAVFGMEYAQAEDDFNRIETNYLNSLGRLAEAEGAAAMFQDLRQRLFIDADSLRAEYRTSLMADEQPSHAKPRRGIGVAIIRPFAAPTVSAGGRPSIEERPPAMGQGSRVPGFRGVVR